MRVLVAMFALAHDDVEDVRALASRVRQVLPSATEARLQALGTRATACIADGECSRSSPLSRCAPSSSMNPGSAVSDARRRAALILGALTVLSQVVVIGGSGSPASFSVARLPRYILRWRLQSLGRA